MRGALLSVAYLGLACSPEDPTRPHPRPPVVAPPVITAPARAPLRPLEVKGRDNWVVHSHGGPPAMLSQAQFSIRNNGETCTLRVTDLTLVTRWGAESTDEEEEPLLITGVSLDGETPLPEVSLAPIGEVGVTVTFQPIDIVSERARHAFRANFTCGAQAVEARASLRVEREADLHR